MHGSNYDSQIWEGLLFVNKRGVTKTGLEAGITLTYAKEGKEGSRDHGDGERASALSGARMCTR